VRLYKVVYLVIYYRATLVSFKVNLELVNKIQICIDAIAMNLSFIKMITLLFTGGTSTDGTFLCHDGVNGNQV